MVNKDRAANIAALNDAFRQQPPRHPPPPCYPYRMPSLTQLSLPIFRTRSICRGGSIYYLLKTLGDLDVLAC